MVPKAVAISHAATTSELQRIINDSSHSKCLIRFRERRPKQITSSRSSGRTRCSPLLNAKCCKCRASTGYLEVKARLQCYGSRSQRSGVLPEVSVLDVVGDAPALRSASRLEVQIVEDIE